MNKLSTGIVMAAVLFVSHAACAAGNQATRAEQQRGRYIVQIAGCNDCHTPNYAMSGGKVAEAEWLTGDRLGWNGPWGTTYPSNLRNYFSRVSEADWLKTARQANYRPPMPSSVLHDMSTADLRAVWRFVRALGPAGEEAPAYLPPTQQPEGPVVRFPMPPG